MVLPSLSPEAMNAANDRNSSQGKLMKGSKGSSASQSMSIDQQRRVTLCRLMIVLLWVLLKELFPRQPKPSEDTATHRRGVTAIVSYHLRDLVEFLSMVMTEP